MAKIIYDNSFDSIKTDDKSKVFQIYPSVFNDNRGYFTEVMKDTGKWPVDDFPLWFSNLGWIRQINRSKSCPGAVRGCHAQKGRFCQAKYVQALTVKIYDIITDARPDSNTFGTTKIFTLDPDTQNALFVPRGFLHSFIVPLGDADAVFEYMCDNVYDKNSELCINPASVLPDAITEFKNTLDHTSMKNYADLFEFISDKNKFTLSAKDEHGFNYHEWLFDVKNEFYSTGHAWYK